MLPDDPRHGSSAGYRAHNRDGTDACQRCIDARRADDQARRKAQTAKCACGRPMRDEAADCNVCIRAAQKARDPEVVAEERRLRRNAQARARRDKKLAEAKGNTVETSDVDDDQTPLAYMGGWVRKGAILVPTVKSREAA